MPDLDWLQAQLERAGWRVRAKSVLTGLGVAAAAACVCGFLLARELGLAAATAVAIVSAVVPFAVFMLALQGAVRRRCGVAHLELAAILELLGLELSAGGSPQAALAGVLAQTSGPLSRDLNQLLIASQLAPNAPLDVHVERLAARLELPPLRSLAAILAMSRQYGCGVGDGVRALAADLRRAQRRELIARSRRALNRVLVPAAVGVLLPFMAILMFPAVAALLRSYG